MRGQDLWFRDRGLAEGAKGETLTIFVCGVKESASGVKSVAEWLRERTCIALCSLKKGFAFITARRKDPKFLVPLPALELACPECI